MVVARRITMSIACSSRSSGVIFAHSTVSRAPAIVRHLRWAPLVARGHRGHRVGDATERAMGMGRTCAASTLDDIVPDFLPSAVQGGAQVAKRGSNTRLALLPAQSGID